MLGAATRRQGLLALDNPKEEVEAQKKLALRQSALAL